MKSVYENGRVSADLLQAAERIDGLVLDTPDLMRSAANTIDELGTENDSLKDELSDMFGWLVAYITPEQAQAWEDRLERVGVIVDWGWS